MERQSDAVLAGALLVFDVTDGESFGKVNGTIMSSFMSFS